MLVHPRSLWGPSQWPSRKTEEGEWKFVQRRKGKPSLTLANSTADQDTSVVQAWDTHRTFLELVLNGPIDHKSTKSESDETLEENKAVDEAVLQTHHPQKLDWQQVPWETIQLLRSRWPTSAVRSHVWRGTLRLVRQETLSGTPCGAEDALRGLGDETVQGAPIAREADVADEKLELRSW